jgi:hypothetical protein
MLLLNMLKFRLQESDNVQALATAYGENMTLEQFARAIEIANPESKPVLQKLFSLYSLDRIMADGVFFLQNSFISAKQSEAIAIEIRSLCHELGSNMLDLTSAFGIPDHVSLFGFISILIFQNFTLSSYITHLSPTTGLNIIQLKIMVSSKIKVIELNLSCKNYLIIITNQINQTMYSYLRLKNSFFY